MDEVLGHEPAVSLLRQARVRGPLHHAYLLTGPSGVGKATLARAFVRSLNCQREAGPCRLVSDQSAACRACRLIERGVHPDVRTIELEAERTKISFKEIEQFQGEATLRPLEARFKAYVILDAERLSATAANQLLKTLEEPPPDVVLVLTAQDAEALLPTIVSRCQQVRLSRVGEGAIAGMLEARYGQEPAKALELARLAQGRVGRAIQLATEAEALQRLEQSAALLFQALGGDRLERLHVARSLADQWSGHAQRVYETLRVWKELARDALWLQLGVEHRVVHVAQATTLREASRRLSERQLADALEVLRRAVEDLEANANPRLALDVALLRLPAAARAA